MDHKPFVTFEALLGEERGPNTPAAGGFLEPISRFVDGFRSLELVQLAL